MLLLTSSTPNVVSGRAMLHLASQYPTPPHLHASIATDAGCKFLDSVVRTTGHFENKMRYICAILEGVSARPRAWPVLCSITVPWGVGSSIQLSVMAVA